MGQITCISNKFPRDADTAEKSEDYTWRSTDLDFKIHKIVKKYFYLFDASLTLWGSHNY